MALVELKHAVHIDTIAAGLVLTGGTAELEAISTLAEQFTGLPARVGTVEEVYGLTDQVSGPAYVTTLGLLRWMADAYDPAGQAVRLRVPRAPSVLNMVRGVGRIGRVFLPQ